MSDNNDKISVAFCCLGNICRSPMAEAIFNHTVQCEGISDKFDKITSFGTAGYHVGSSPDKRSVHVCVDNGVYVNHKAQQIGRKDFDKFDYILAMDRENLRDLNRIKPSGSKAKVLLFGEFKEDPKFDTIVDDPYYGGVDGFQTNFDQITHFSNVFLKKVCGHIVE